LITASIKDNPAGAGLIISVGLHIALILLVMFGLPIFWQPEPLPEVIGIQLAQLSDITAAPKAQKVAPQVKKGADAPKVEQKQPPKPDTPPPPPVEKQATTPPPPAPTPPQPETKPAEPPKPEEAEVIPDKTKQPEKKPEEKKPEPPKPEQKKVDKKPDDKPKKDKSDDAMAQLLNQLNQPPAPDTKADKTKKATPAPQQDASEAPQASQFSEIPLTASEADGIAKQVHDNWNIGSLAGAPDIDKLNVTMHITLQPDGTITSVTYDNDQPGNPYFRQAAESGRRALLITKKLQLPPGKTYEKITFIFRPSQMN